METAIFVLYIAVIVLYILTALLAAIYSLPILCVPQFQRRNNMFTLNICLAAVFSCLSWLPTSISPLFGCSRSVLRRRLPWLYALQVLSDMTVPFSLVLVSFHRCSSIVFPQRRFFRTKKWMIVCFIGQWIVSGLLTIPDFVHPRWVGLSTQRSNSSDSRDTRLGTRHSVAESVSVVQYGHHPSHHLLHHDFSDLPACASFTRSCSDRSCRDNGRSEKNQPP